MGTTIAPEDWAACAKFLEAVQRKGVQLWTEGDRLCVRAPKGVMEPGDLEKVRVAKEIIMRVLDAQRREAKGFQSRNLYPLAYTQFARWRSYQEGTRRAMRQIAFAIRWRGSLDSFAMRESVSEITRRHDALRTSIVARDDRPLQELGSSGRCDFAIHDFRAVPAAAREGELLRLIDSVALSPVDLALDPLFSVQLISLDENEHVILVAMEHMIADMSSLAVVESELFSAYDQQLQSGRIELPPVAAQFTAHALSLRDGEAQWRRKHMGYWNEHLAGCGRVRFPQDESTESAERREGWNVLPFRLANDLRHRMQERCRQNGATLPLGMLTAYAALVMRWCDVDDLVIQYQTDGRIDARVENTIGFFASALYMRTTLQEDSTFRKLMSSVMGEYCRASEHADLSLIAAEQPPPEYAKSTSFNWVPLTRGSNAPASIRDKVEVSTIPLAHLAYKYLQIDQEPGILLYDTGSEVVGALHYPAWRFSEATKSRFVRSFRAFLSAMTRDIDSRIVSVALAR